MPTPAPDRPRIVHILNCLAPDGANRGQLVTYADGAQKPFGDASLIRAALAQLGGTISPALTAALAACDPAPSFRISKKTSRKATSSAALHVE